MCGFALAVRDAAAEVVPSPGVDAALSRRGPDTTARHVEGGLAAVSTRLIHWEEGASQQPLLTEDGGMAVFNGELFNLSELQDVLGLPGASEIEVLLAGVRAEGPEFARRIDGQFAAVVRVGADAPVLALRDRFGISPLYVMRRDGATYLASALEALSEISGGFSGGVDGLDVSGVASILHDWAPTHGRTPFAGVDQVMPGQVVQLQGDAPVRRWMWADHRAAPVPSARIGAAHEAVTAQGQELDASPLSEADLAEFEQLMRDSVAARMRSTSEIVALISGGIDSTIIATLAHDEGARTGLALFLEGDEIVRGRQVEVAEAIGYDLVHHMLRPRAAVTLLEEYVRTRRVPLVRMGPIGMMSLARRAASEGIRGVLSGEGADELFGGYDSYRILAARAGAFGDPKRLPWDEFGEPEFGGDRGPRWARSYWRAVIALSSSAGSRRADIMKPVAELFGPQLRTAFDAAAVLPEGFGLEDRRQVDLRDLLGSYLLTVQGDHAWMEEGVELRPAYLATPVARYALRRDPASFVSIRDGKVPVRSLLRRLAAQRPAIAGLGFPKSAFRVDASFVLRDSEATAHMRRLVTQCPDALINTDGVIDRFDRAVGAGTCSESESMVFLLAASLGVLAAD
ncbi:Asparagine synthetase [glutamine-hydrolyzing] 1 [Dermatophilus congolensis]|uniref:asparagine synthase (glutamine-hydrolyzing) n=1 Tax=Dermatophilus congolensis TaxID=1863 RepID=A0A239VSC7_9MICO|nr:Asparagine synthetase [glutamine-hydrolyzing] 1 [Dermatophilus congolensis]